MTADNCQRTIRIRSAGTLAPMLVLGRVIESTRLYRCIGFLTGGVRRRVGRVGLPCQVKPLILHDCVDVGSYRGVAS
jgi:hypothetical protein